MCDVEPSPAHDRPKQPTPHAAAALHHLCDATHTDRDWHLVAARSISDPCMLRCSLCRRWDAKTLTNIGLWAFVVPFAIYQGCIGEVRMLLF